MRRFLILFILSFAACGNCEDDTQHDPTSNNSNSNNKTTDNTTGVKKSIGEDCTKNAQCESAFCEKGECVENSNGPRCGGIYCEEGLECLDFVNEVCGINELPNSKICTNDGKVWCQQGDDTESGECCEEGKACLFEQCIVPGEACDDKNPCPLGFFCEPTLDKCISNDINPNTCTFLPPIGEFEPVEAYSWTGSKVSPEYDQVMMMPAVANLTDDNQDGKINEKDIPDIVFSTFWAAGTGGSHHYGHGVLRVINGADASEHWSSTGLAVPFEIRADSTPAIGDIDYDGFPDIIIEAAPSVGGIYALTHDGTIKWHNKDALGPKYGGVAIANVDGKGGAEIVTAQELLSSTGETICTFTTSNVLPMLADLDGDNKQEMIIGSTAYRIVNINATDGTGCAPASMKGPAGFTAIADLNGNKKGEIVSVENGELVIYDNMFTEILRQQIPVDLDRISSLHNTTCTTTETCNNTGDCVDYEAKKLRCYQNKCVHRNCNPGGGPPTIADFDGDGQPEIGIAARWYYLVYETDGSVLWAHKTKDFSSAVTGSSVFDFEGDGKAEVVYNDEAYLRVYSGNGTGVDADGDGFNDAKILLEEENTSGTLFEYPVIVDVDNDGSAEIVVSANDYAFKFKDKDHGSHGIRVFKDVKNRWVGTRKIWNQHTYHVTNINEDGSVPLQESVNWLDPDLNNYRQNVQGGNLANAPNFVASVETEGKACASGFVIKYTIKNTGSIGVRIGALSTTIFAGKSGETLNPIVTLTNTLPLGPGASETTEYKWAVPISLAGKKIDVEVRTDFDEQGMGRHNECIEDDNTAKKDNTLCNVPQ